MLDDIRLLCRGKSEPIKEVYERFNRETDDGKDMAEMSELLSEAIDSIIDVKEEAISTACSLRAEQRHCSVRCPGWMTLS